MKNYLDLLVKYTNYVTLLQQILDIKANMPEDTKNIIKGDING